MTLNVKRKTNQFFEKFLFEQAKRKIKQKTFAQINKISIFFDSKIIWLKKSIIYFIFDESRIVELNFNEKSIFFSFFAEFSFLIKVFFFRIHTSLLFNFFQIYILVLFNKNFEIINYFICYIFCVMLSFCFCLNQIITCYLELQKQIFFLIFLIMLLL